MWVKILGIKISCWKWDNKSMKKESEENNKKKDNRNTTKDDEDGNLERFAPVATCC